MANDVTANGVPVATDEIAGRHHQLVKLEFGVEDSATMVSSSNPLPVTLPGTPLSVTLAATSPGLDAVEYETVAASATNQALGATGATGDYLAGILVIPATTSPGAVSVKDGAGSAITVFTGGATSVGSLVPFFVPLGIKSTAGAWQVTTGTNVSVLASGNFT